MFPYPMWPPLPICFDGSFDEQCQQESVPKSLVSLMNMILCGSDIKTQSGIPTDMQVSQLIRYNIISRSRKTIWHRKDREAPLPVYLGLLIHAQTRKKGLIVS